MSMRVGRMGVSGQNTRHRTRPSPVKSFRDSGCPVHRALEFMRGFFLLFLFYSIEQYRRVQYHLNQSGRCLLDAAAAQRGLKANKED